MAGHPRHGAARRRLTLARDLLRGGGLGHLAAPQESVPSAGEAPALAKPGDDAIEDDPLHPERGVIAIWAAITARDGEEEAQGRDDEEEDENPHEDRDENHGVRHKA